MILPEVLSPISDEDVENHLVKLTKRLIKDINSQYAYMLQHVALQKDPNTLLIHYNEVRYDLNGVIYNIKCAMGRLSEENFIQPTLVAVVKEIENIGYLVIHPSLTFNSVTLGIIIDKIMNTIHTSFIRLVDISESPELTGDSTTRREINTLLNDLLLILERTNLHCPAINIYDEKVTINVSTSESIKKINISEGYHKMFISEIISATIYSLHDIIHRLRKSMYGYNQTTREFLRYSAEKLNTGLIDLQNHVANVIKSEDDAMYESIKGEVFKFFTNCNSVYEWIVDTGKGTNLKYESSQEEDESEKEEESEASAQEPGASAMEDVDVATLDEQRIIEALIFAKSQDADQTSQVDEIIKMLKAKCTIGDVHGKFEDSESIAYRELQRRLTSDYVLLSRRFIREVNVLFNFVNKICIRKLRFNKQNCNCEVCKGEL